MPDDVTNTGTETPSADTNAAAAATATTDTTATTDATATADAAATQAAADAAALAAAQPPEKYDLKVADGVTLDPALVEKTAATARTLGLSQEKAQQMLDFTAAELAASREALLESYKPGGAEYTKQEQAWAAAALADPDIGGSPEKLAASVGLAEKVLGTFGDDTMIAFLNETKFGSHPSVIRMLSKLGASMGEGSFIVSHKGGTTPEDRIAALYPSMQAGAGA